MSKRDLFCEFCILVMGAVAITLVMALILDTAYKGCW